MTSMRSRFAVSVLVALAGNIDAVDEVRSVRVAETVRLTADHRAFGTRATERRDVEKKPGVSERAIARVADREFFDLRRRHGSERSMARLATTLLFCEPLRRFLRGRVSRHSRSCPARARLDRRSPVTTAMASDRATKLRFDFHHAYPRLAGYSLSPTATVRPIIRRQSYRHDH
jgi:hypothetical protein